MKTHHDLDVWKDSISLTKDIYPYTKTFPGNEKFGLASQMQRSAVSIASNIAEGAARRSDKDFLNFLYYSLGSISELETHIIISNELNYVSNNIYLLSKLYSVKKLLSGLINFIKKRIKSN